MRHCLAKLAGHLENLREDKAPVISNNRNDLLSYSSIACLLVKLEISKLALVINSNY